MSFWGSLFGGSSPQLNTLIGQYGQAGSSLLGQGQSDTNQAGNFFSSILSGDSSKISRALAPEISAAKTSNAQDQKTNTEFGTRSGGTTASNAAATDKLHSYITNLIGSLTGSSASNLASLGTSLTGQGLGALGQEQGAVDQQMANWQNSILGKGVTTAAAFAESYGLSKIPGAPKNNQSGGSGIDFDSSSYQPVWDNDGNQVA